MNWYEEEERKCPYREKDGWEGDEETWERERKKTEQSSTLRWCDKKKLIELLLLVIIKAAARVSNINLLVGYNLIGVLSRHVVRNDYSRILLEKSDVENS